MSTSKIRYNHREFDLCIYFNVKPMFQGTVMAREVRWWRPLPRWTKVSFDGVSLGHPGVALCGGIFRMCMGFPKGCFALSRGIQTSMFAELMGFIVVVKLADTKNWFPLWIETESTTMVSKGMSNSNDVPWTLKVTWRKCLNILRRQTYRISYIFREESGVADRVANVGLRLADFAWWFRVPNKAFDAYRRNLCYVTEFKISD